MSIHGRLDRARRAAAEARFRCIAIASLVFGLIAAQTAAQSPRPNFLLIVVDDQSPYDLRAYEPQSALQTPHLDRLAAEGIVLDAAHHMGSFMGAVCTPSRHMLMSGRSLWRLPIGPGAARDCPPHLEEHTLGAVFRRAGYATMHTSKIGNSYDAANRQFAVQKDATKRAGNDADGSAWHADRVLEFLDAQQADGDERPLLIHLGFSHPHDTRDGKPELLAHYGAVNHADPDALPPANSRQPPLPINYLPAHPFPDGHPELRDEVAVSGVWRHRDERTIRNEIGRQFACCEDIDAQIGRVFAALRRHGRWDNTYVIYTSDHGMAIGRHGLQGKQNLYEHTWRVPLMVRGPGIAAGRRAPGNVYLLDLLATLCDLAEIPAPASNEGVSFRPVLEGRVQTVRDTLYGVYSGGTRPGIRCVKRGPWKLIKYDVLQGQVHETQLFNLLENPYELLAEHSAEGVVELTNERPQPQQRNLANDPAYAETRRQLEAELLAEMRRWGDPDRLWDQPGAVAAGQNGR